MDRGNQYREMEANLKRILNVSTIRGDVMVNEHGKSLLTVNNTDSTSVPSRSKHFVVFTPEDLKMQDKGISKKQVYRRKPENVKGCEKIQQPHHHPSPASVTSPSPVQISKKKEKPSNPKVHGTQVQEKCNTTNVSRDDDTQSDGNIKGADGTSSNIGKSRGQLSNTAKPASTVKPHMLLVKKIHYLDENITHEILEELRAEHILPLKKKNVRFAQAKYHCRLCDFHCDNIPACRQHASNAMHKRRKEIQVQDQLLKKLPRPSERQLSAIDALLEDIFCQHGLSDADLAFRAKVLQILQEVVSKEVPSAKLCMYGSSLTGFGLKTADLNINLMLSYGENPAICLTKIYNILCQSDGYHEVRSNFKAKVPSVLFVSTLGCIQCQITVGGESSCLTSQYLAIYAGLDPRVRKLAVVFKYWARICDVDKQERGSLPAYNFSVMTIFFLQQCNPSVLPVLWKDLSEAVLKRPKTTNDEIDMLQELKKQKWTSSNSQSIASLWLELLLFYGINFDLGTNIISVRFENVVTRAERKWKSRRIALEDPFSTKRNAARSLYNMKVFDYFYNCLRRSCLYFSLPTTHQNVSNYYKCLRSTTYTAKENERLNAQQHAAASSHNASPFQTNANDIADKINLNKNVPATKIEKNIEGESNILENEFFKQCRLGLVKSVSELEDHLYKSEHIDITDLEDDACKAFVEKSMFKIDVPNDGKAPAVIGKCKNCDQSLSTSVIQNSALGECSCSGSCAKQDCDVGRAGAKDSSTCDIGCSTGDKDVSAHDKDKSTAICDPENCLHITNIDNMENVMSEAMTVLNARKCQNSIANTNKVLSENTDIKTNTAMQFDDMKGMEDRLGSCAEDIVDDSGNSSSDGSSDSECDSLTLDPISSKQRVSSPLGAEYLYEFTSQALTDGKGASIFCSICDKEGHLKIDCPEDKLPELIELPPMTMKHLQLLSGTISQVPRDFSLSDKEANERDLVRQNLELHIKGIYPDAELTLFGSSMNGFGFHHSDLDICVTFRNTDPKDINFIERIEVICKRLKMHRGLYAVFPILTAKVPIVKFTHRNSHLDGDISLYNTLACRNSKLVLAYAKVDHRVQTLGYAIKVFAKVCEIGDASRGSLSSYAYILMMIHYLQHTKPPVVPVLQELCKQDTPKPEYMVEGCDSWFYDNINNLLAVWPGYHENKQSVGELWMGFFRYYLEEFSFTEHVVSIRRLQLLSKFEKLWIGKCIAVEDPFDLNHNLGGALSRKMNHYIQLTFIHARKLYCLPIENVPPEYKSVEDYFFDKKQLVENEPPSDRLCRVCCKIGHIAKECPKLIARKEREAAERQRKKEMQSPVDDRNNHPRPNQDPPKQMREFSSRSLSDPGNTHRMQESQHSQSHSQPPDKRQMIPPLMNVPMPDQYGQRDITRSSPQHHHMDSKAGSPHQGYTVQSAANRQQPQNNVPKSNQYNVNQSNHGYTSLESYQQPRQQYSTNQQDSWKSLNPTMISSKTTPQFSMNQNTNFVSGISEANRQFPSSQHHHQQPSAQRDMFYEGTRQVFGRGSMGEKPFGSEVEHANPTFNSLLQLRPFAPFLIPMSMSRNEGNHSNVCYQTSPHTGTFPVSNTVPANRFAAQVSSLGTSIQSNQGTVSQGAANAGRVVNVQKGTLKGQNSEIGVTVRNEFYRGKHQ